MQVTIYSSEIVSIEGGGSEAKYLRLVHQDSSSLIFIDERLAGEITRAIQWAFPKALAASEDEALDKWASEHEGEFTHQEAS